MRKVDVNGLVHGERAGVVIERLVERRGQGQWQDRVGRCLFFDAGEELDEVAKRLRTGRGRAKGVVAALEKIRSVLEAFPLLHCEEVAEVGFAQREGLVGAEGLHTVDELRGEVHLGQMTAQSIDGSLEVRLDPFRRSLVSELERLVVGVRAVARVGQGLS